MSKPLWEKQLCDGIAEYMEMLTTLVMPTKGLYVSCDGVVCAAKRRQQRLRRFKGPWIAKMEAALSLTLSLTSESKEHEKSLWDQNALTPGSAFMAFLGGTLTDAGKRLAVQQKIQVIVSTTSEPGEGEHKLLRHMRSLSIPPTSCVIYGLDADLILLSMLLGAETGAHVRLFREAQEFERDTVGADEWRTLDIRELARILIPTSNANPRHISDFVACMSLLGNDFLPRSLTHTVRDDGIPAILGLLRPLWSDGGCVVDPATGGLRRDGLLRVLKGWAASENADMLMAAVSARRAAHRPNSNNSEWNAQPARWASLTRLLTKTASSLIPSWTAVYDTEWHAGSPEAYLAGLAWVWEYYAGRPVDQGWYFDEHLPPRWSSVVAALTASMADTVAPPPIEYAESLPEWLHLLAVLPAESVMALLPPNCQRLMARAPWYWPSSWSVFDVGRTVMWECEPVIPILPDSVLREWTL